jgi:hypothetical protein
MKIEFKEALHISGSKGYVTIYDSNIEGLHKREEVSRNLWGFPLNRTYERYIYRKKVYKTLEEVIPLIEKEKGGKYEDYKK